LKPEDLRASRIVVVDPAPIPADEMQRTYEWVKSWGMLEDTDNPLQLVDLNVQARAHEPATAH
jgi:NitT/TauT family transport system substrate-binding protein